MLATKYKSSVSHDWAYPVGAEKLSQVLEGVPQFDRLRLCFYHSGRDARLAKQRIAPYPVLMVEYRNLRPSTYQFIWENDEEKWGLSVCAVPSEARRIVEEALASKGFALLRSWLTAKRTQVWFYGYKRLTLSFDVSTRCWLSQEEGWRSMAITHFPYWYRLSRTDAYLIWYTDEAGEGFEADGVLLDDAGRLLTFLSLAALQAYAGSRDLSVDPEINAAPLDLDSVVRWLGAALKTSVDCPAFLSAWNLFSDLASAVQGKQAHIDDQKEGHIYEKLFWGSSLPALTPPGKRYAPIWTKSEVGRLRNVLSQGMQLFRGRLSE